MCATNAETGLKVPPGFKDYFSGHAADYARYRPTYPEALFSYCAALPERPRLALDCATGSGQAARGLAPYFATVVGIDASPQQILAAPRTPNVSFAVAPAERAPLPGGTVDLVMVAQALHWLDHGRFYAEVRRLLSPGGALVVTTYDFLHCTPAIDAVVSALREVVDPYWPPERAQTTREGFLALPFPFVEEPPPPFVMAQEWELAHLVGYISTWSAVRRYMAASARDPVRELRQDFAAAWGDPEARRVVRWPLTVRVGRA